MEIKPKKSLGQNFLRDQGVADKIIENADLSGEDIVIEIGPGTGVLTGKIANVCKKVIAIEIDDRLVGMLRSKLRSKENVEIIHGDILKINLRELTVSRQASVNGYIIIANLPYYITSPIIRLLLEMKAPPKEMILMVQKEVAERIVAKPGNMSILAISVQYYAEPEYLFTVPRTAFEPQPEVDSAVIKISPKFGPLLSGEDVGRTDEVKKLSSTSPSPFGRGCREATGEGKEKTKKFFRIVRAGFSAKRKTLANNLSSSLKIDKKEIEGRIQSLGFSKNVRAQELSVEDWKNLVSIAVITE